jgi:DNA repair protein RadD
MSTLRDFQVIGKAEIYAGWANGARNLMPVFPTGSGKTVIIGSILQEQPFGPCQAAIAHRQELVSQIALALNRENVAHGIIAPDAVVKQIVTLEQETHGRSLFNPRANTRVAGVDSLGSLDLSDPWVASVGLVVQDEGHHVLRANKWGRAMDLFPNARGLFPTAHAIRGDGKGLGRHADGLVDQLIVGPSCRQLINRGFLTDYRLIAPPDDTDLSDVGVTDSGDFSPSKLREAIHKNKHIVGDVVQHYLRFAPGKLGVTFAVDIEAATEIVRAYQAAGVAAEVITADTPLVVRGQLMRQFRARQIMQLVSVDVLGEGVDVPAIEVVSMARHTMSFQLYAQQFGRSLRVSGVNGFVNEIWDMLTDDERKREIASSPKPKAIIIDHVNNYQRHGLPDVERTYTLDKVNRKKKKKAVDEIPLRACLNPSCFMTYEAALVCCPHCGFVPVPVRRGSPEMVEGDLIELDPEVLAELRREIARVDNPPRFPAGLDWKAHAHIQTTHEDRQEAQRTLRHTMAVWMGWQAHQGRDTREAQKRFYYHFGKDVATAQTMNVADANELLTRITFDLQRNNVVERTA